MFFVASVRAAQPRDGRCDARSFGTAELLFLEIDVVVCSLGFALLAEGWPGAVWHREVPISASIDSPHGRRRIDGAIDLLVETPNGG